MTEELKPCPFCGGKEAKLYNNGIVWVVECRQCLAKIGATFEKDAVDFWNYRPKEEQLGEQISEMKQKNAALKREILEAREDNCENMEYHVAERERLKSENARLRKALEKYAAPEHHFSVVDGKVWEVFDNSYGVDEQEFGTWARNALNGMDK